jgi:DNA-binding transcriptional LysR family regulator
VLAGPLASPKVATESVGTVSMAWLASPELDLPVGPMSAADLALWPVISDAPGAHLHGLAMEWFRAEGVEPERHHGCSSLPTRLQLGVEGLGVILAPPSAATRELAVGSLRAVATTRPMPALEYVVAYADIGRSPAARLVAETVKELLGEKPDLQLYYSAVART